jgi:hypothetical protein
MKIRATASKDMAATPALKISHFVSSKDISQAYIHVLYICGAIALTRLRVSRYRYIQARKIMKVWGIATKKV